MEPTGSEKVVNKVNVTINLLILTTAVLVQFCELLINKSSSKMFKSGDDTVGCDVTDNTVVFIITCSQCVFH